MLARSWMATIDEARADEYELFARNVSLPMFEAAPGFLGVVMTRSGDQCSVLTLWHDIADVTSLEASEPYRRTVAQILDTDFIISAQATTLNQVHVLQIADCLQAYDCTTLSCNGDATRGA